MFDTPTNSRQNKKPEMYEAKQKEKRKQTEG